MYNYIPANSYCKNVFDGTHDTPKASINGFPLITSKNILGGILNSADCYNISEVDYDKIQKRSKVSQWDILFSMIGSVGEIYLEKSPVIPYAIKNVGVFSCEHESKAKLLYYYLKSPQAKQHIQNFLNGAVQKFLPLGTLRNFPVIPYDEKYLPSIDLLFSVDSKIELNNRINTELETLAKTIYDYWFVQFDFPTPSPSGRAEVGLPYKSSGGKMVWNEELKREIPEGWENGFLSSLGEITGGSTPPREIKEYFTTNGTAWITPKDLSLNTGNKFITRGELDVSDKGIKAASLNIMPKGTILLSSRAPVGYLAISREDVTTNQGFKSFVPNKGFTTEFVYYSIKNMIPAIENNAVGSTFKEISAATLKTIPICLSDKKIVDNYTDIAKPIFDRQNNLEIENQKLTELRDWLLPMLMNGQVTVGKAYEQVEGVLGMVAEGEMEYKKI